jgi:hypothetical protein
MKALSKPMSAALLQRVNQIAGLHAGHRFVEFDFGAGDIAAGAVPSKESGEEMVTKMTPFIEQLNTLDGVTARVVWDSALYSRGSRWRIRLASAR